MTKFFHADTLSTNTFIVTKTFQILLIQDTNPSKHQNFYFILIEIYF